jgi:hypothetical protein
LKGIGRKIDEGSLCLGVEDVNLLLLSVLKQADGELNS